ncbi:MAG: acyl-CoA dehydrogenase family protein [Oleibacter sp.]|nr:acyl-CoA dehydrogenase family protein [Thalassolituus sp.]
MAIDIQGLGLKLATRFSGSDFANRYGLRKRSEELAYQSTKKGFEALSAQLKKRKAKEPALLPAPAHKGVFDLTLSDEQQMIKDSLQAYASEVIRPLAHDANEAMTLPDRFLEDLMDIGVNMFSVPEEMGGVAQGWSPITSAIIAEELARGDFSLAYAALAPVAVANAIVKWGTKAQQEQILPRYLSDTPIKATIAAQELNTPDQTALLTKARKTRKGYRLNGIKTMVPFGGQADLYLVSARVGLANHTRLFLVDGKTAGVSFKASAAMGLRACGLGQLKLKNVDVSANALLGDERFDYQAFQTFGQLHWCAMAVGACQAALDYVVPYVNDREAFGEPISHRQSVAFMVADLAIELESMRLLVWRAAALAEEGKPCQRQAYLAHIFCTEKAMKIGTDAVQLLGGHGFTKEHPAERWYRDLRVLACVNSGMHL